MDVTLVSTADQCWKSLASGLPKGFVLFQQPALRRVINSLAKLRLWGSCLEVRGTPEELEARLSCDTNGHPPTSLVCPQRQAITAQGES